MIELTQMGDDRTSIRLSTDEGKKLQALIEKNIHCRLATYVEQHIGLRLPNYYAYISGQKKVTFATLERLLSGTDLSVQCHVSFVIQKEDGGTAVDAPSMNLDDMLYNEDMAQSEEDVSTEKDSTSTGMESPPKNPPNISSEDLEDPFFSWSEEQPVNKTTQ